MKTWLFCLGMIFIAQPLAAQSPAAPTNVVLNLTPTDSLGLFLPGYDVIPQIGFEVADTLGIASVEIFAGIDSVGSSLLDVSIPFQAAGSYFFEGISVVRSGTTIWVEPNLWSLSSSYYISVKVINSQGIASSPSVLLSTMD